MKFPGGTAVDKGPTAHHLLGHHLLSGSPSLNLSSTGRGAEYDGDGFQEAVGA